MSFLNCGDCHNIETAFVKDMPFNARSSVVVFFASLIIPLLVARVVSGQSVPDPSFETPAIAFNSFVYNPAGAPWIFSGTSGIINAPGSGFNGPTAPDGNQYAFLQTGVGGHAPGAFSQTITFTLAGTYQLTYSVAGRPPDGFGAFGDVTYDVRLDSTIIGTDSTKSSQPFTAHLFTFVTSAGDHTLTFEASPNNADNTAFIDGVSIVAVPEPTSIALLAMTGAGLAAARRFRNNRAARKVK